jgi:hypothetical protein
MRSIPTPSLQISGTVIADRRSEMSDARGGSPQTPGKNSLSKGARMRLRRVILAAALLAVLALAATGCSSANNSGGGQSNGSGMTNRGGASNNRGGSMMNR